MPEPVANPKSRTSSLLRQRHCLVCGEPLKHGQERTCSSKTCERRWQQGWDLERLRERRCHICKDPLPLWKRVDAKTHGPACKMKLSRRRRGRRTQWARLQVRFKEARAEAREHRGSYLGTSPRLRVVARPSQRGQRGNEKGDRGS